MIIDSFLFFNEIELLRIRLEELKDVVDYFVIVEGSQTFSGKAKGYLLESQLDWLGAYDVIYVKTGDFPLELDSPWQREAYTRNAVMQGLQDLPLKPNDVFMHSDLDEIPRASVVAKYADVLSEGIGGCTYVFSQSLHYYYVNCRTDDEWHGTRMTRIEDLKTPHALRSSGEVVIRDAGWHFSYLGGAEAIRAKIGASIHTELDLPEFNNATHIEQCMEEGQDLFGRAISWKIVPIDDTYPCYLRENLGRYSSFFWQNTDTLRHLQAASQTPSDINEHLNFLYRLASTVEHITEFGTRHGSSTTAFLCSKPKALIAYDIERESSINGLETLAAECGVDFEFRQRNVLEIEIEPTDLLFIDTWHVDQQIREELRLHAHKSRRYIVLHDTETYAHRGETAGHGGIWQGIAQFARKHPEWLLTHHFPHNNGLTVLTRMDYLAKSPLEAT